MSNLTVDEGLIREHTPEPLEGHTVVVLERVGEAGERFHSLIEPDGTRSPRELPGTPDSYYVLAVPTSRDHRLAFFEHVRLLDGGHEFELRFSMRYRVEDARKLVSARDDDPLRRVRDRAAEMITEEIGTVPWSEVRDSFTAASQTVLSRTRAELNTFAHNRGITILELTLRTDISAGVAVADRRTRGSRTRGTTERARAKPAHQRRRPGTRPESSDPDATEAGLERQEILRDKARKIVEWINQLDSLDLDAVRGPPGDEGSAGPAAFPPEPGAPPQAPPPAENSDVLYRVWYATNRRPAGTGGGLHYGARLDARMHLGRCDVAIPATHRMGELGSPWIRRFLTRTDDRLRLQAVTPLEADHFWSGVRDVATSYPADKRHALVFIHGYRVSFKAAALRAAQLGYDLGVRGPVAFFSWPSRASVLGYPADGAAVEASERAITDFLIQFAQECGADRVHVIAHSMGNRPLLRALQRILSAAGSMSAVRFGHLVLAAPDVTRELFLDVADQYRRLAHRTTLYVSDEDNALRVSFRMQGDRVGLAPPVTCAEGIDTIHVGNVDGTMLGHSTFAEARPVLNDIHALLNHDTPPGDRHGLDERKQGNERYWEFRA